MLGTVVIGETTLQSNPACGSSMVVMRAWRTASAANQTGKLALPVGELLITGQSGKKKSSARWQRGSHITAPAPVGFRVINCPGIYTVTRKQPDSDLGPSPQGHVHLSSP